MLQPELQRTGVVLVTPLDGGRHHAEPQDLVEFVCGNLGLVALEEAVGATRMDRLEHRARREPSRREVHVERPGHADRDGFLPFNRCRLQERLELRLAPEPDLRARGSGRSRRRRCSLARDPRDDGERYHAGDDQTFNAMHLVNATAAPAHDAALRTERRRRPLSVCRTRQDDGAPVATSAGTVRTQARRPSGAAAR